MPKKTKLSLVDLKVQSFVTKLNPEKKGKVRGGLIRTLGNSFCGGYGCDDSNPFRRCTGAYCPTEVIRCGDD